MQLLSTNAGTRQGFTVSDGARRQQSSNDKGNETKPVGTTSLIRKAVFSRDMNYIMYVFCSVKIISHPKNTSTKFFFKSYYLFIFLLFFLF